MYHNQPPFEDSRLFNFPWFSGGNTGPGYGESWSPNFPDGPSNFPGGPANVPGGQPSAGQTTGPPSTPPPPFTPEQPPMQKTIGGATPFAIDPGSMRGCLFQFTYVWLNWESFWFYPVAIGRRSVSGFRWHRNRWVYYGVDLNHVQSFQCY